MMERVAKIKAQWISRSQARARFIQDEACTFLDDMKYLIDLIEHADATSGGELLDYILKRQSLDPLVYEVHCGRQLTEPEWVKILGNLHATPPPTQASEPCRELREALGDALSLANVPEHAQDAEWNTERDRLTSIYNAALSTRGDRHREP